MSTTDNATERRQRDEQGHPRRRHRPGPSRACDAGTVHGEPPIFLIDRSHPFPSAMLQPPNRRNPILNKTADPVIEPTAIRQAHMTRTRAAYRDLADARREKAAAQVLAGLDRDGREVYGLTRGQFSLIDILETLLAKTGPARLHLCTWTATGPHIARLAAALNDGRILSGRFLVDVSFTRRCPQEAAAIRSTFGADAIRVTRTHAKFSVIENDGWQIAVRCSANLNTNPRAEHYEIGHDPKLAAFLLAAMDDCWRDQGRTLVNQPIRDFNQWWHAHG
jgi:hypothetical protein